MHRDSSQDENYFLVNCNTINKHSLTYINAQTNTPFKYKNICNYYQIIEIYLAVLLEINKNHISLIKPNLYNQKYI